MFKIFFISVFCFFFVVSAPYVNKWIEKQFLKKTESLEYDLPNDMFLNEDNSTIFMSVTSNKWISSSVSEPEVVGKYKYSKISSMFVDGNLCFTVSRPYRDKGDLQVFDISDPFDVVRVGHVEVDAQCIFVEGDYLYISIDYRDEGYETFEIWMMNGNNRRGTSPGLPVPNDITFKKVGKITENIVEVRCALVENNLLYILDHENGLMIYDVEGDKSSPIFIGGCCNKSETGFFNNGKEMYLHQSKYNKNDKVLYIPSGLYGILIVNVTKPSFPEIINIFEGVGAGELDSVSRLFFSGKYVYATDGDEGIKIYDISVDPFNPSFVSSFETDRATDIYVVDKFYAFVTDRFYYTIPQQSKLLTIDISDVLNPRVINSSKLRLSDPRSIYYHQSSISSPYDLDEDNYLIVSDYNEGLRIINITDPTHPNEVWRTMDHFGLEAKIIRAENPYYLYVIDNNRVYGSELDDDSIYDSRIRVLDVRDHRNPKLVGYYQHHSPTTLIDTDHAVVEIADIFIQNNEYLYYLELISDQFSLVILQIQIESQESEDIWFSFQELGRISTVMKPYCLLVEGEYAYIGSISSLEIFNISDKSNPTFISEGHAFFSFRMTKYEDLLFISSGELGFKVFNVSDVTHPVKVVDEEDLFINVKDAQVLNNGEIVYLVDETDGFKLFNISSLEVISSLNTRYSVSLSIVTDTHNDNALFAYVVDYDYQDNNYLIIVDIRDKNNPQLVDSYYSGIQRLHDVVAKENYVYLASGECGIKIIRMKVSIEGTSELSHFCGTQNIGVVAHETFEARTSTISQVAIQRDNYCYDRGVCLPNYECECFDDYEGDYCETWSCDSIDFKAVGKVCGGRGDCIGPNKCDCRTGFVGKSCQRNLYYFTVMTPVLSVFVCVVCCLGILICTVCFFVCLSGIGFLILLFVSAFWVIVKQTRGLKKFGQLKNFDLLLKEQELEEDESIAHLKINQNLFKIDYSEIKLVVVLGEGGSNSVVYKATWNEKVVAFKCFKTRAVCSDQVSFDEFEREVAILGSVSHPNILQFYGCSLNPPRVGIVMEFCENGDINTYLRKTRRKNEGGVDFDEKLRICREIILSLDYLHSRSIIHRDLKLENVLLDRNVCCKLMDFGLSRIVDEMSQVKTKKIGTSYFMAPEVLTGDYNEKIDVFAFGICVFIILTEKYNPYEEDEEDEEDSDDEDEDEDEDEEDQERREIRRRRNKSLIGIEIRVANDPKLRPNLSVLGKYVPQEHVQWLENVMKSSWSHSASGRPSFRKLAGQFREGMKRTESGSSTSTPFSSPGDEESSLAIATTEKREDGDSSVLGGAYQDLLKKYGSEKEKTKKKESELVECKGKMKEYELEIEMLRKEVKKLRGGDDSTESEEESEEEEESSSESGSESSD